MWNGKSLVSRATKSLFFFLFFCLFYIVYMFLDDTPLAVEVIGKAGSKFIQEELSMDNVYDYMFHLLNEYAKLLKYKPKVPPKAVELCSESMVCNAQGLSKAFMMESLVKEGTRNVAPCSIPRPYDDSALYERSFVIKHPSATVFQARVKLNVAHRLI